MNLVESVSINARQAQCPWSQACSKLTPSITLHSCEVMDEGEDDGHPAGSTRQGRVVRERQEGGWVCVATVEIVNNHARLAQCLWS
jgi:hypothetical protein